MSKTVFLALTFSLLSFLLFACSSANETNVYADSDEIDVRIAEIGDLVKVHYTGTLDDGEQFDSSDGKNPLSFTLGAGNMISGFDNAVIGMTIGESITVRLEPKDAYGEKDKNLIVRVPTDKMPEGATVGSQVLFSTGAKGTVIEITGTDFVVDANHDLAGRALTFDIELISIQ